MAQQVTLTHNAGADRAGGQGNRQPPTLAQQGAALHRAGRLEEAILVYAELLRRDPAQAGILNNLGVALRMTKRPRAAIPVYLEALRLEEGNVGAWSNLGNAFRDVGRFAEAIQCHRHAVSLDDHNPTSVYNLALALRDDQQIGEALELFDTLIAERPDNEEYQWDRAIAILYTGDFERGWPAYDWRLKLARAAKRAFGKPRWTGDALGRRTLFLHSEQGFGDMIQFARFVTRVAADNPDAKVIVECAPVHLRLMASVPGDFEVVSADEPPPPFDVYAPLLSLPLILGIGPDEFAQAVPYMSQPSIHTLRLPPARPGRVRIGIVWAGKLTPRDRSAPLENFIDLAATPGTDWYSLQLGGRTSDLKTAAGGAIFQDLSPLLHDFADTAAAMAQLDLIITIDTASAHLAGAMGKPVWNMLTSAGDWRWLHGRADSLWYPTMRLFRQPSAGEWDPPFAEAAAALDAFVSERTSG